MLSRLCDKSAHADAAQRPSRAAGSSRGRREVEVARPLAAAGPTRAGRRARPASRVSRRPARRCPSPRRRRRLRAGRARPRAIAARSRPRRHRSAASTVLGTPSSDVLDRVGVGDDRTRGRRRSSPGSHVSRAATSPPVHDSAVASVSPRSRQQLEHELLDRAPRSREKSTRCDRLARASPRARRRGASAPDRRTGRRGSRSRARRSSPPPRLRHRRRPRAPAPPPTPRRRRSAAPAARGAVRAREQPASGSVSSAARPERLQLARRPGQRDGDARADREHERRSRADEPGPRSRPRARSPACARPWAKSAYGRFEPLGDAPRPASICASSSVVDDERDARRRARAARPCGRRGSARARRRRREVAVEPVAERGLELVGHVADDPQLAPARPRARAASAPGTARSGRCGRHGRARTR